MLFVSNSMYRVRQMVWTEHHDGLLFREILNSHPSTNQHEIPERKQCWNEIAAILNSLEQPCYQVKADLCAIDMLYVWENVQI